MTNSLTEFEASLQELESVLPLLTPAERSELASLTARPTFRQIIDTIPLSVLCAMVDAFRRLIDTKGPEGSSSWPEFSGVLDVSDEIKDWICDAFEHGCWRGPPDPPRIDGQ